MLPPRCCAAPGWARGPAVLQLRGLMRAVPGGGGISTVHSWFGLAPRRALF